MKNSYLFLCGFMFIASISFAQKVNFERSFELAKTKALEQKKPLLVYMGVPTPPQNVKTDDSQKPEVIKLLNTSFICYSLQHSDSISRSFMNKYRINRFPAYIFFDYEGGLLMKEVGVFPITEKLMSMFQQALELSKGKTMSDYDEIYKSNNYDLAFLKTYLQKREQAGITDQAEIIEKYVDFLKVSDLESYEEVLFILKAGPLVDGKAYRLAYLNRKLVDSIYKTEDLETRKNINNRIISNSMNSAVKEKNPSRAMATANFTRGSWTNNYVEGNKSYTFNMIRYYQAVKDTSNYFRFASNYYDQYYMRITVDSIKRIDSLKRVRMRTDMEKQLGKKVNPMPVNMERPSTSQRMSVAFTSTSFSSELNNAAYYYYDTGTKNQIHLLKAMNWTRRAIELEPVYGYYDTLAHIYYRLGFYLEAESNQEKAIELGTKEKKDTKYLKDELQKIRDRSL